MKLRSIVSPRSSIAAGLLLLIHACGGGSSPSAPSVPRPAPAATPVPAPSFLDGFSHAAVAAVATPALPATGQVVSVEAAGFLVRQQAYTGAQIFLWPGDQDYLNALVYGREFTDGSFRMVRWPGGFTVTLDGDLADNDAIVAKTQEVIAEMTRVTGLPIALGPGGACVIALDNTILGEDNAVGEARLSFQGANISHASLLFVNRRELAGGAGADYPNTLLHEMGHALGLLHSPNAGDVMTPGRGAGAHVAEYQAGEATALHMMYAHRTAGNLPPDREPTAGARSTAVPRVLVIRD